jgi:hypothetical protein
VHPKEPPGDPDGAFRPVFLDELRGPFQFVVRQGRRADCGKLHVRSIFVDPTRTYVSAKFVMCTETINRAAIHTLPLLTVCCTTAPLTTRLETPSPIHIRFTPISSTSDSGYRLSRNSDTGINVGIIEKAAT